MLRDTVILGAGWKFQIDPEDSGEGRGYVQPSYDAGQWRDIEVPCSLERGHHDLEWYMGVGWYRCAFHVPEAWHDRRIVLHFQGVNYHSQVWINGQPAGQNEDGFLPFELPIHDKVRFGSENVLLVKADNHARAGEVPGIDVGWRPYGGILREVTLETTGLCYVSEVRILAEPAAGHKGTFSLAARIANETGRDRVVSLSVTVVDEAGASVGQLTSAPMEVPAGQQELLQLQGTIEQVAAWSPSAPALYTARARLQGDSTAMDELDTRFGFRRIEASGASLLLNGEPLFLTGCNRHEDSAGAGMCTDLETVRHDLLDMKEMGCNFVRLCHYPHHPGELDLCDELGLLAMDEIPLYGSAGMSEDEEQWQTKIQNARRQLETLIKRDWNHPSLILWSVSNETHEEHEMVVRSNEELIRRVRELDASRLAVHVADHWSPRVGHYSRFDEDDVICINEYPWMGDPTFAEEARLAEMTQYWTAFLAELHQVYPDKPILITEFGYRSLAGVLDNMAGEDVHARVLEANFAGMDAAHVCGATIWCYADHAWPMSTRIGATLAMTISPYGIVNRQRQPKTLAWAAAKRMFTTRQRQRGG